MIEAELEFEQTMDSFRTLVKKHSAMIKIRDIRRSQEGIKDLVDFFVPPGDTEGSHDEIHRLVGDHNESLVFIDDNHITAIVNADECNVCSKMLNWDLFLTEAHTTETGSIVMRLLAPDEATLAGFLERLENDDVAFRLLKKARLTKKKEITIRQEYVVKTALDLGFFEYPKKINLEGLSKRLNVSYVTLAEILRRAEKNIITSYFKQGKN